MNKLLVVCGPTAIGKTSVGVKLGERYNGEIISADSRQVYKGLDIGTGKDLPVNSKFEIRDSNDFDIGFYRISHLPVWLIDMATPDQQVTVADWINGAKKIYAYLIKKGKLPMIVGGSGFYIKGLIDGIETIGIPPDEELRQQLSQLPVGKLQQKLANIAPRVFNNLNQSDKHNPHRLIRKIEIAKAKKSPNYQSEVDFGLEADVLKIGLKAPKDVIYQRIDQRVEKRLDQGLLDEIGKLLDDGYDWDDPGMNTLAYKEFKDYFDQVPTKSNHQSILEKCVQRWKYDEHGYARQQLTWFKKDKQINWFDITRDGWFDDLNKMVNNWYSKPDGK